MAADMSGFTSLSERLSAQGLHGIEALSAHLNAYFGPIVELIHNYEGDVAKFAGDAILVCFPIEGPLDQLSKSIPLSATSSDGNMRSFSLDKHHSHNETRVYTLREAILRACSCALAIHSQFDNFSPAPGVTLRLHSAISAGLLHSVHVGGHEGRWEWLLKGQPLYQLGQAMKISQKGEIVLHASAFSHVGDAICSKQVDGNNTGYLLLRDTASFSPNVLKPHLTIVVPQKLSTSAPPALTPTQDHSATDVHSASVASVRSDTSTASLDSTRSAGSERIRAFSSTSRLQAPRPNLLAISSSSSRDQHMTMQAFFRRRSMLVSQSLSPVPDGDLQSPVRRSSTVSTQRYMVNEEDDARCERALRAYIPAAVLNRVAAGHRKWLCEFRRCTTLFILLPEQNWDSKDPSIIAQSLQVLQAIVLSLMVTCSKHKGDIRQLITDDKGTVMIMLFGLQADWSNPLRGARAAMDICDHMRSLGHNCRIGVTTGQVWLGTVGNYLRCEYAAIGDKINTAARLMIAVQSPTGVYVDQDTVVAIGNNTSLAFDALPPIQVKGKSAPVPVFEPYRRSPSANTQRTIQHIDAGWEERMVGRKTQRDAIDSFFSASPADERFCALLYLEAESRGIGKSVLLSTVYAKCLNLHHIVFMGVPPDSDSLPYAAFESIVQKILYILKRLQDHKEASPCNQIFSLDTETFDCAESDISHADWLHDPDALDITESLRHSGELCLLNDMCSLANFQHSEGVIISFAAPVPSTMSGNSPLDSLTLPHRQSSLQSNVQNLPHTISQMNYNPGPVFSKSNTADTASRIGGGSGGNSREESRQRSGEELRQRSGEESGQRSGSSIDAKFGAQVYSYNSSLSSSPTVFTVDHSSSLTPAVIPSVKASTASASEDSHSPANHFSVRGVPQSFSTSHPSHSLHVNAVHLSSNPPSFLLSPPEVNSASTPLPPSAHLLLQAKSVSLSSEESRRMPASGFANPNALHSPPQLQHAQGPVVSPGISGTSSPTASPSAYTSNNSSPSLTVKSSSFRNVPPLQAQINAQPISPNISAAAVRSSSTLILASSKPFTRHSSLSPTPATRSCTIVTHTHANAAPHANVQPSGTVRRSNTVRSNASGADRASATTVLITSLLTRVKQAMPSRQLVFLIDDAHELDSASEKLLLNLCRRLPWLIVVFAALKTNVPCGVKKMLVPFLTKSQRAAARAKEVKEVAGSSSTDIPHSRSRQHKHSHNHHLNNKMMIDHSNANSRLEPSSIGNSPSCSTGLQSRTHEQKKRFDIAQHAKKRSENNSLRSSTLHSPAGEPISTRADSLTETVDSHMSKPSTTSPSIPIFDSSSLPRGGEFFLTVSTERRDNKKGNVRMQFAMLPNESSNGQDSEHCEFLTSTGNSVDASESVSRASSNASSLPESALPSQIKSRRPSHPTLGEGMLQDIDDSFNAAAIPSSTRSSTLGGTLAVESRKRNRTMALKSRMRAGSKEDGCAVTDEKRHLVAVFVPLPCMTEEEINLLLLSIYKCQIIDPKVAALVTERSGGVPLFAEELAIQMLNTKVVHIVPEDQYVQSLPSSRHISHAANVVPPNAGNPRHPLTLGTVRAHSLEPYLPSEYEHHMQLQHEVELIGACDVVHRSSSQALPMQSEPGTTKRSPEQEQDIEARTLTQIVSPLQHPIILTSADTLGPAFSDHTLRSAHITDTLSSLNAPSSPSPLQRKIRPSLRAAHKNLLVHERAESSSSSSSLARLRVRNVHEALMIKPGPIILVCTFSKQPGNESHLDLSSIPISMDEMIAAQIDALPVELQLLLRICAVYGRIIDARCIQKVWNMYGSTRRPRAKHTSSSSHSQSQLPRVNEIEDPAQDVIARTGIESDDFAHWIEALVKSKWLKHVSANDVINDREMPRSRISPKSLENFDMNNDSCVINHGDFYAFRRAVAVSVVYNRCSFSMRGVLHKTIAEWIEHSYQYCLSTQYSRLAFHYQQASEAFNTQASKNPNSSPSVQSSPTSAQEIHSASDGSPRLFDSSSDLTVPSLSAPMRMSLSAAPSMDSVWLYRHRAIRYLRLAGEQAVRQGARREALSWLYKAMEFIDSLPDAQELSWRREFVSVMTLYCSCYSSLHGLHQALPQWTKLCSLCDEMQLRVAKLRDEGESTEEACREVARSAFFSLRGYQLSLNNAAENSVDINAARLTAQRMMCIAENSGEWLMITNALTALAFVQIALCEYEDALGAAHRAYEMYLQNKTAGTYVVNELSPCDPACISLAARSTVHCVKGDFGACLLSIDWAVDLAERIQEPVTWNFAIIQHCFLTLMCGTSENRLQPYLDFAESIDREPFDDQPLSNLASVLLTLHNAIEAEAHGMLDLNVVQAASQKAWSLYQEGNRAFVGFNSAFCELFYLAGDWVTGLLFVNEWRQSSMDGALGHFFPDCLRYEAIFLIDQAEALLEMEDHFVSETRAELFSPMSEIDAIPELSDEDPQSRGMGSRERSFHSLSLDTHIHQPLRQSGSFHDIRNKVDSMDRSSSESSTQSPLPPMTDVDAWYLREEARLRLEESVQLAQEQSAQFLELRALLCLLPLLRFLLDSGPEHSCPIQDLSPATHSTSTINWSTNSSVRQSDRLEAVAPDIPGTDKRIFSITMNDALVNAPFDERVEKIEDRIKQLVDSMPGMRGFPLAREACEAIGLEYSPNSKIGQFDSCNREEDNQAPRSLSYTEIGLEVDVTLALTENQECSERAITSW